MQIIISNRDFTTMPSQPMLTLHVDSLSWSDRGGPSSASLTASGGQADLWTLIGMMRCPVNIYDDYGVWIWGGYISAVTVSSKGVSVGFDLNDMFNDVRTAYSYVAAGSNTVGVRKTTAAGVDASSVATYGTKQLLDSSSGLSDAAAVARRDATLAHKKYPQGVVGQAYFGDTAQVTCKGWWSTLAWQLAVVAGTGDTDSVTQITDMITANGPLISGVVLSPSTLAGQSTNQFRSGDYDALTEIDSLMDMGGPNGLRLIASLDNNRLAAISEEPADGTIGYYLGPNMVISNANGATLEPAWSWRAIGTWVQMTNIISSTADVSHLLDASQQYITGGTLSNGVFVPEFRGTITPGSLWNF